MFNYHFGGASNKISLESGELPQGIVLKDNGDFSGVFSVDEVSPGYKSFPISLVSSGSGAASKETIILYVVCEYSASYPWPAPPVSLCSDNYKIWIAKDTVWSFAAVNKPGRSSSWEFFTEPEPTTTPPFKNLSDTIFFTSGTLSEFTFVPTITGSQISLESGALPEGLWLETSGEIKGKIENEITTSTALRADFFTAEVQATNIFEQTSQTITVAVLEEYAADFPWPMPQNGLCSYNDKVYKAKESVAEHSSTRTPDVDTDNWVFVANIATSKKLAFANVVYNLYFKNNSESNFKFISNLPESQIQVIAGSLLDGTSISNDSLVGNIDYAELNNGFASEKATLQVAAGNEKISQEVTFFALADFEQNYNFPASVGAYCYYGEKAYKAIAAVSSSSQKPGVDPAWQEMGDLADCKINAFGSLPNQLFFLSETPITYKFNPTTKGSEVTLKAGAIPNGVTLDELGNLTGAFTVSQNWNENFPIEIEAVKNSVVRGSGTTSLIFVKTFVVSSGVSFAINNYCYYEDKVWRALAPGNTNIPIHEPGKDDKIWEAVGVISN